MGGGRLGPDLSNAGMTYTGEQMREALLDPHKTIAERHRGVKVVERAGITHEGILLNEDAYSPAHDGSSRTNPLFHESGSGIL